MSARRVIAPLIVLCPLGCAPLAQPDELPAVLVAPTPAARAELERVVGEAANGAPVLLADDALTRDSALVVERRTPPGPDGRAATGRTLEAPLRLRLVSNGESCTLVRESDGRRWSLTANRCERLPRAPSP